MERTIIIWYDRVILNWFILYVVFGILHGKNTETESCVSSGILQIGRCSLESYTDFSGINKYQVCDDTVHHQIQQYRQVDFCVKRDSNSLVPF